MKRYSKYLIPFLIILTSAILRFYKTGQTYIITNDEEVVLTIATNIVKDFHIEWIGVNAADTGFYMGSFWIYFTAFWIFLSKGNPLITSYVGAGIGVITTFMVYLTSKTMFGEKAARISSFLYAVLPFMVYSDQRYWDPTLTSLLAVALVYCIYKFTKKTKWLILIGFLSGMIFHVHLSLVPLILVVLFFVWKNLKRIKPRTIILTIFFFLVVVSPMITFDYFHKGSNIATPVRVGNMVYKRPDRIQPLDHLKQLFITLGRFWYLIPGSSSSDEMLHSCSLDFTNAKLLDNRQTTTATRPRFFFSLISFIFLFTFFLKKSNWKCGSCKILVLSLGIIIIAYIFLPNIPLEYYLLGVYPLFLFIPGIYYQDRGTFGKKLFNIFLIIIIFLSLNTIFKNDIRFGLLAKRNLVYKVMEVVNNEPFELEESGLCHKYEAWRYLFKAYGDKPVRSSTDVILGWLYKDEISKAPAAFMVVINESRVKYNGATNYQSKLTSGGFDAYIYKSK